MVGMAKNPNDPLVQMAAQMFPPPAPVDPHASLTAPISPAPIQMSRTNELGDSMGRSNELGDALPEQAEESPAVPKMSAQQAIEDHLSKRLMADYQKDADPYGSADNHPGFFGKLLHGLSVATGGPGRRQFEEEGGTTMRGKPVEGLESRLEGLAKDESTEGLQGATAAHENAETPEIAPNAESTRNLQGAETAHDQAETNALQNPTPKWEVHDTEDGPILYNPASGTAQHLSVDGQPIGPKITLKESQPINGPDGKPHVYMLDDKGNKVKDLGVHYEKPNVTNVNNAEKNLWSVPQPDGSKKVVSLQPGMTIPEGAVSLSGQSTENSKSGAADAPTQSALTFANDYLKSGAFTGPSDEALQDQFFQMAKPSSGFRMNQAQLDQLHNMASWLDSWRGRAYHAVNGTWFAPKQREQIVQTMNDLAKSKGINTPAAGGDTLPVGTVQDGYKFKGGDRYDQKNWEPVTK